MPVTEEQSTVFEVRRGAIKKTAQPAAEEVLQPSGEEQPSHEEQEQPSHEEQEQPSHEEQEPQPTQETPHEEQEQPSHEEQEQEQQGDEGAVEVYVEKLHEAVRTKRRVESRWMRWDLWRRSRCRG